MANSNWAAGIPAKLAKPINTNVVHSAYASHYNSTLRRVWATLADMDDSASVGHLRDCLRDEGLMPDQQIAVAPGYGSASIPRRDYGEVSMHKIVVNYRKGVKSVQMCYPRNLQKSVAYWLTVPNVLTVEITLCQ